jgi:hypothetical protein
MKKSVIIFAMIYGCLLALSCNDNETNIMGYERDNSLAGSISFVGYKMEAKALYNDQALDNFQYDLSHIDVRKVSDNEVFLFCFSKWDDTTLIISIPVVAVLGQPHDAIFDYLSNDATVTYNGIEYTSINSTIKGSIKEIETQQSSDNDGGSDPATPSYDCEINIECNVNGKVLNFKILSVKS